MYHPSVTLAKIDVRVKSGKPAPRYHTREQVQDMIKRLDATREVDEKGNVTVLRPLTPQEHAYIQNERFLCRVDFHYFSSRYCFIKNAQDQVVQFLPWVSQNIYLDTIAENELAGIAIMLQVLKARQLGLSRITSLLILHRAICFPHVNAVIASSTPDKTRMLANMLEFVFDRLPWWLIPEITARREGEFLEFGKADTGITLQHGSQMTGIARGTTPTVGHLSELAEFLNPKSIVDSSLLRAMHDSPRTMLILEGTAEGQHNWWHDKWLSAKDDWPQGRSRLRPLFLPWFCGSDLYPNATWLRARPVPNAYTPAPYVLDHARRASEYVASNSLLTKYLGRDWQMPLEQQWFYEVERGQAQRENRLPAFLQEMPASDDEAFQSTNISIFTTEIVTAHRDRTVPPIDLHDPTGKPCVYGLYGPVDLVPSRLQPHFTQVDPDKKPIEIICNWSASYPLRFTLQPLKWEGYPGDSGRDHIYFWERPEAGNVYGMGVDTADGIDKDLTSLETIRKGDAWGPAAQVCEFVTSKLNALDTVPYALALATYFSVPDGTESWEDQIQSVGGGGLVDTTRKQCRVAIECKGSGDQTQLRMRMAGWHNFHPWQRVDNRKLDPSQYNKIGVFTNSWFRDAMMEYMMKMLRDMELEIRSPYFVGEMQSLEASDMNQKIKAAHGATDDRFMSLGFAVISLYQWDKHRTVATIQQPRPTAQSNSVRRYARYTPSGQDRVSLL